MSDGAPEETGSAEDGHLCPFCKESPLETAATLPSVRADGLGAQFDLKTIAGCRACVRKQLVFQSLVASLEGWTSPTALVANPVLVTYGFVRASAVRKDEKRVRRLLRAAGIDDPADLRRPVRIAYGLAAALITSDGKVYPEEVKVASSIGKDLFPEFDEEEFLAIAEAKRDLPTPADLAIMLNEVVDEKTKRAVDKYLVAIADADDEVAAEEHALLKMIAHNLGLTEPGRGFDRSV